jgi:hypothetical protein
MPHSSRKSLHNNIFDKNLKEDQIYEELNQENINELYTELKDNSENGLRSLVIFDDVQKALNAHAQHTLMRFFLGCKVMNVGSYLVSNPMPEGLLGKPLP